MNISLYQGHGYVPFDMEFPRHPPVKSETKTRYSIYKGNVSSFYLQYDVRNTNFAERDLSTFPLIDHYIPVLTPRVYCSEAALQLAENTTFVFIK